MMSSSLLSRMTGYRIKSLYHQMRSRSTDPCSSMLHLVNPEIDQQLTPRINDESNAGAEINERANAAPKRF